jgi:hypothetical protein
MVAVASELPTTGYALEVDGASISSRQIGALL